MIELIEFKITVFYRNDADDVETAQSSHQLTEDKKDVALETELETRTPSSSIIGLTFVRAIIIDSTGYPKTSSCL
ncbi:unnamed protein product [Brugia timori]|uniref:Uncharacterized protein n=1 Tax=Brugia timori TaxID=42155 RepID=A0A0R3QZH1_9BILA|nr:unnamed protein product [Brugia timori]